MDSVGIEVLRAAEHWGKGGPPVALGPIVKTWGSAPRPIGAMVAVRDDGQVVGSVSGGCVEDDLIDKVKAKLAAWNKPELFTYGVTNEEATRWGLPCGGTLQLVMEPLSDRSEVPQLLERIGSQQLVRRKLDMDSGSASLEPGRWRGAPGVARRARAAALGAGGCGAPPASSRATSRRWRACSTTTWW